MTITMKPVTSSQIAAIGHDPETNTLAIRFKNYKGEPSTLYHYANVDAEAFKAFSEAPSIGSHFIHEIKPKPLEFPFVKIDESGERGTNGPQ